MQELSFDQKLEKATKVVCKQGIFPFSINKTTKAIIKTVVDDEDEPRILNDETKKLLTSMGIEFEDLDPIPMTKIKVKKEK